MNKKLFPPLKSNPAKTLLQSQQLPLLPFPKNPNKNDNKNAKL